MEVGEDKQEEFSKIYASVMWTTNIDHTTTSSGLQLLDTEISTAFLFRRVMKCMPRIDEATAHFRHGTVQLHLVTLGLRLLFAP